METSLVEALAGLIQFGDDMSSLIQVFIWQHIASSQITLALLVDEDISFAEALFHEGHRTRLPFPIRILSLLDRLNAASTFPLHFRVWHHRA